MKQTVNVKSKVSGGLSIVTDGPVAVVGGEARVAERSHRMYLCEE